MTALHIREAGADDLATIVRFYAEDEIHTRSGTHEGTLLEPYEQAFEAICGDPNNRVYVAELDGVVVGTFQLTFIQQLSYRGGLVGSDSSRAIAA